ncbi:hypothetical protein [Aquibaculum arenosum]|uniref:Uncharacterized protein n=1 Tax=Aquibaculum arenosum TaxID=3032591 RepID=A0ABT5YQN8_9PROT|nr:hypothetical protein [Fodinicurvata sp. CAU 1616]MDF2097292.1 hypothetical protein [Fodinicurvata sp. CAU 1616]
MDDVCVSSLAPLAEPGLRMVLRQEWEGALGNNFIAATPGHPMLSDALEEASEETLHGGNESIWLRTGPGVLTRACARFMVRIGPQNLSRDHRVLLNGELSRYVAIHRPLSYKLDKRNWTIAEREGDHLSIRELYTARRNAAAAA